MRLDVGSGHLARELKRIAAEDAIRAVRALRQPSAAPESPETRRTNDMYSLFRRALQGTRVVR